jgi:hypothetical protein
LSDALPFFGVELCEIAGSLQCLVNAGVRWIVLDRCSGFAGGTSSFFRCINCLVHNIFSRTSRRASLQALITPLDEVDNESPNTDRTDQNLCAVVRRLGRWRPRAAWRGPVCLFRAPAGPVRVDARPCGGGSNPAPRPDPWIFTVSIQPSAGGAYRGLSGNYRLLCTRCTKHSTSRWGRFQMDARGYGCPVSHPRAASAALEVTPPLACASSLDGTVL